VHRQRDRTRPSARQLVSLLALTLSTSSCLLDPLKIGPGDELSDDASDLLDESGASASTSSSTGPSDESSEGSSSEGSSSEADADASGSDESSSDESSSDTGEPTCGPQGALPEDACESLLGFYWDGASCLPLFGCGCGPECPPLFETAVDCWSAYLSCGPSPCAGLDEAGCLADPLCTPHYARPLVLDIDAAFCAAPPVYAGCGLAIPCANGSQYACAVQDPDAVHLFTELCLPEWDWFECDPPTLEPIPDCP
jgi:hypothetical protein